jgi:dUTP pyrophosphatase
MIVKFKKMRPNATIPSFGHNDPSNAGLDLYLAEDCEVGAFQDAWVPTGVAWAPETPPAIASEFLSESIVKIERLSGWKPALFVRPRSSMAKRGLRITEGTVDAGYRGEIMIHVRNVGPLRAELKAGDRIAQAVPILLPEVVVEDVAELPVSDRGDRGFGSSGR